MKLKLVFDIDGVIAAHDLGNDMMRLYALRKNLLFTAKDAEHAFLPGVQELMKYLFEQDDVEVHFFSSGDRERNNELVEKLLISSLGAEKYRTVAGKIIIKSKEDLIPRDNVEVDSGNDSKIELAFGNKKKDLRLFSKGEELDRTLIIEDDPSYVSFGQHKKAIIVPGGSFYYTYTGSEDEEYWFMKDKFEKFNTVFFQAGIISKVIQTFKANLSIQSCLHAEQFKTVTHGSNPFFGKEVLNRNYSLKARNGIYELGLEVLKTVNSSLEFFTAEHFLGTVMTPRTEEESNSIDESRKHHENGCCIM